MYGLMTPPGQLITDLHLKQHVKMVSQLMLATQKIKSFEHFLFGRILVLSVMHPLFISPAPVSGVNLSLIRFFEETNL